MQADLAMGGHKVTGLVDGVSLSDAASVGQVQNGGAYSAEVTVASASTTDVLGAASFFVNVTGTVTITSLGSAINRFRIVRFAGILTLTYNATSLILPGAVSIVTAVGDVMGVESDASGNARIIWYQRSGGADINQALTTIASATTTDLGTVLSQNVSITGTTAITAFGSTATLQQPLYRLTFAGILTLTYNATSLILPGAGNIITAAGDTALALYLGSGNWQVLFYNSNTFLPGTQPTSRSFKTLIVRATSDTNVSLTADELVVTDSSGRKKLLTSVSLTTIAVNASGANGLDTGTATASNFYFVYVIYNQTTDTKAGLLSLSATAPTLPSGYTFKELYGVVRYDSGSKFWRMVQFGRQAQIIVGTNPTIAPVAASGVGGTYNDVSPTLASVSLAAFVPSIAAKVFLMAVNVWENGTGANVIIAPNVSWGGAQRGSQGSSGQIYPIYLSSGSFAGVTSWLSLETLVFAWASSALGGGVSVLGWELNL